MQIGNTPSEPLKREISELGGVPFGVPAEAPISHTVCEATPKKYPIAQTLRALSVGESVSFPCEQRTSMLVTAARIKKELARLAWDYAFEDDPDNFIVKFTRTN